MSLAAVASAPHEMEFELSDGQRVTLPAGGFEGAVTVATFPARLARLRALLPHANLRPLVLAPGVGALAVACHDWRKSPIGPYAEVGLAIPLLSASPGTFARWWLGGDAALSLRSALWQFPVTTELAALSGRELYGFPKWRSRISFASEGRSRRCRVDGIDGESLLTLSTRSPRERSGRRVRFVSHLELDSERQSCSFDVVAARSGLATGLTARARIDLGPHPLVHQLAGLLLARRALAVLELHNVSGTLSPPDRMTPSLRDRRVTGQTPGSRR